MNFSNLTSGFIGSLHLAVSLLAMVLGLFVLFTRKGTPQHRKIGYIYVGAMLAVNLTALMIYRLFGRFGMFHWMAVVSLLTLAGGMYPMLVRKSKDGIVTHFSFMYWSVVGLYAAFVSEVFVRLPKMVLTDSGQPMTIFYKLLGVGIALTMGVGVFFFLKYRQKWEREFGAR